MARRSTGYATTWWGKRWTSALEALGVAWRNRLPRGRTYAREGRVVGLTVESGTVSAYVVGSQPSPYEVQIRLEPLDDEQWHRVVVQLVERAAYTAKLLAGEMPDDIEDAFSVVHVSLFPTSPDELELACTCPDKALPCKHVAATHYMLGEAFDHDPFLLFALRGHDRDALLAGMREARAEAMGGSGGRKRPARKKTPAKAPRETASAAPDLTPESFVAARGVLETLSFRIEPPAVRLAVLQSLGKPPGWRGRTTPADVLDSAYVAASQYARGLALKEAPEPTAAGESGDAGKAGGSGDAGEAGGSGDAGEAGESGDAGEAGNPTTAGDAGDTTDGGPTAEQ